jgi:DNA-binding MarR family transcriptional regulator
MEKSPFDLKYQNANVESRIIAAFERISMAFRVLLWNEGKEHALSPIQIQVLIFLLHHSAEKRKVSYLAQEFNVTKATISDTVKALDKKGLIRKVYDSDDNRSYHIHLSTKGKQMAQKTALFGGPFYKPIDQLPQQEKEDLLRHLLKVIEHLTAIGVITLQRMCFTCVHYRPNHQSSAHFCALMNKALKENELRIDCPEHEAKAV